MALASSPPPARPGALARPRTRRPTPLTDVPLKDVPLRDVPLTDGPPTRTPSHGRHVGVASAQAFVLRGRGRSLRPHDGERFPLAGMTRADPEPLRRYSGGLHQPVGTAAAGPVIGLPPGKRRGEDGGVDVGRTFEGALRRRGGRPARRQALRPAPRFPAQRRAARQRRPARAAPPARPRQASQHPPKASRRAPRAPGPPAHSPAGVVVVSGRRPLRRAMARDTVSGIASITGTTTSVSSVEKARPEMIAVDS